MDTQEISATDAKARFAELLRAVERGETFEIKRHGKTIARIAPVEDAEAKRRADWEAFKAARKTWEPVNATVDEILEWRDEGRR